MGKEKRASKKKVKVETEGAADDASVAGTEDAATGVVDEQVVASLQAELEAVKAKAMSNWEAMLRGKAELENVRKRAERDVENAHKYSIDKIINELLPVVDSLERGLQTVAESSESSNALADGVQLTLKMLQDVLQKFNVQMVDPLGEVFDPAHHEALSMQAQEGAESGKVLIVVQKGYLLHGRVLRPARVIVAQ